MCQRRSCITVHGMQNLLKIMLTMVLMLRSMASIGSKMNSIDERLSSVGTGPAESQVNLIDFSSTS